MRNLKLKLFAGVIVGFLGLTTSTFLVAKEHLGFNVGEDTLEAVINRMKKENAHYTLDYYKGNKEVAELKVTNYKPYSKYSENNETEFYFFNNKLVRFAVDLKDHEFIVADRMLSALREKYGLPHRDNEDGRLADFSYSDLYRFDNGGEVVILRKLSNPLYKNPVEGAFRGVIAGGKKQTTDNTARLIFLDKKLNNARDERIRILSLSKEQQESMEQRMKLSNEL